MRRREESVFVARPMTPTPIVVSVILAVSLVATACRAVGPPPAPTSATAPLLPETNVNYLPGRGVELTGRGDSTTGLITPQYTQGITVGISVVTLAHDGQSDFTVQAIANNQPTVLVAATGPYQGSRPLVVQDDVAFQIKADGNWTIRVEPLRSGGQPAFSGTGDSVGQFFQPPASGQWSISGTGSKLNVQLHCLSGDLVVVDTSGPYQATATISALRGQCFWEVQSDGTWSLIPQFASADPTPRPVVTAPSVPAPLPTSTQQAILPTPGAPLATATLTSTGPNGAAGAQTSVDLGTVLVLAATSLSEPFQEIASALLVGNSDASSVTFNFASPRQLGVLLDQGADADVFASADQAQIDRMSQANRFEGQVHAFARSSLVLVTPRDNPKQIQHLQDLARPPVRWVTTDPSDLVEQATLAMLDKASFDPAYGTDFRIRAERNILARTDAAGDVVLRVQHGEADATVVYASDVTPTTRPLVQEIAVPDAVNVPAMYSMAVLKGPNARGGQAFASFVLTSRGQDILAKWGFVKPDLV